MPEGDDVVGVAVVEVGSRPSPPQRVRLTSTDFERLDKDELCLKWRAQDEYLDFLEEKLGSLNSSSSSANDELVEKLKTQLAEATKKESVLAMRLVTKDQEQQDLLSQIADLKNAAVPGVSALRSHLVDPAVNFVFVTVKKEQEALKQKLDDVQSELNAWKFTPDSQRGKLLMAKCRQLYQENEELGKVISSGRLAKLEGDLALHKNFCNELKKSQTELEDLLSEQDEDIEGMQSVLYYLQREVRQLKEENERLKSASPHHSRANSHSNSAENEVEEPLNADNEVEMESEDAADEEPEEEDEDVAEAEADGGDGDGEAVVDGDADVVEEADSHVVNGNLDDDDDDVDDEDEEQSELVSSSRDRERKKVEDVVPGVGGSSGDDNGVAEAAKGESEVGVEVDEGPSSAAPLSRDEVSSSKRTRSLTANRTLQGEEDVNLSSSSSSSGSRHFSSSTTSTTSSAAATSSHRPRWRPSNSQEQPVSSSNVASSLNSSSALSTSSSSTTSSASRLGSKRDLSAVANARNEEDSNAAAASSSSVKRPRMDDDDEEEEEGNDVDDDDDSDDGVSAGVDVKSLPRQEEPDDGGGGNSLPNGLS